MTDILINDIINKIQDLKFVDHNMMKQSLIELKNIIGLDSIKKTILEQVIYTLVNRMDNNVKRKTILHTLITGDPGLCKTTIARIIGKLLASSGFFITNQKVHYTYQTKKYTQEEYKLKAINSRMDTMLDNMETIKKLILPFKSDFEELVKELNDYDCHLQDIKKMTNLPIQKETSFTAKFKEVTRDEFVGMFQGHTANNVKKIFMEARGGVLFFDEAYSILNSSNNDDFGQESINMINKLMTDMSDEVIVIFAGYKDKIFDILFKNQRGLQSRFLWHFEIEGYTNLELTKIFIKQLNDSGFTLDINQEYIENLISNNKNNFTHYGRDTEKLVTIVITEYSVKRFFNNDIKPLTINQEILNNAINKYKKNYEEPKHNLFMFI
ncbi:AAA family ATPase [Hokovirus HKV1]|uniref:AAA family ATPase n=1 Tax=Hokovirus HKV1 TaxID=1977638 RepID=A0A1V0SET0_9VIRU|nr:AAA family ATPase [Hokovirus HKV1]